MVLDYWPPHAHLTLFIGQGSWLSNFHSNGVTCISNNCFTMYNYELMFGRCTCQC